MKYTFFIVSHLRISHFNILNGGEHRLDEIFQTIQEMDSDICGILEAVSWQDANRGEEVRRRGKELGYPYFFLAKANSKYNIAVFSKLPLETEVINNRVRHVILRARIQDGPFSDFQFFFLHLSPGSEEDRLKEVDVLLKKAPSSSPVILMGDFNSLSFHDASQYEKEDLLGALRSNGIEKYGLEALRFDVIKKIEQAGFSDVFQCLHIPFQSTAPTLSNKDLAHAANLRIDYGFINQAGIPYLSGASVFKKNISDLASDHYPLVIDLES